MNTFYILVCYFLIALLLYFSFRSAVPYGMEFPSGKLKGQWLNNENDTDTTEEEHHDTLGLLALMWPCTLTVAIGLFLIIIVHLLVQMLKNAKRN